MPKRGESAATSLKRSREEGKAQENLPQFKEDTHVHRFNRLRQRSFGDFKSINWATLEEVELASEVRQLLTPGSWDKLLEINEQSYQELTLEVLATFTIIKGPVSWHREDQIQFQLQGKRWKMSFADFAVHLGLYTREYTTTDEHNQLLHYRPPGKSKADCWKRLSTDPYHNPRTSKASSLRSPALRYIHAIFSRSITGRRDSTGVVGSNDFLFLLSLVDGFKLHLGWVVAKSLLHQGTDSRVKVLFAGPYITRLAQGLHKTSVKFSQGMTMVGTSREIDINTLRAMNIAPSTACTRTEVSGILKQVTPEQCTEPTTPDSPAIQFTKNDQDMLHWLAGGINYLIQQQGRPYPPPPMPPAKPGEDTDHTAKEDSAGDYHTPSDELVAP